MSTKICCDRCGDEIKVRSEGTKVCFDMTGPVRAETGYFGPDVCGGCLSGMQRAWRAVAKDAKLAAKTDEAYRRAAAVAGR